jgi:hypothetical protein
MIQRDMCGWSILEITDLHCGLWTRWGGRAQNCAYASLYLHGKRPDSPFLAMRLAGVS